MAQARTDQSLVRLNESITLLERQMEEGRKAIEQVLHAEITSRYIVVIVYNCYAFKGTTYIYALRIKSKMEAQLV